MYVLEHDNFSVFVFCISSLHRARMWSVVINHPSCLYAGWYYTFKYQFIGKHWMIRTSSNRQLPGVYAFESISNGASDDAYVLLYWFSIIFFYYSSNRVYTNEWMGFCVHIWAPFYMRRSKFIVWWNYRKIIVEYIEFFFAKSIGIELKQNTNWWTSIQIPKSCVCVH